MASALPRTATFALLEGIFCVGNDIAHVVRGRAEVFPGRPRIDIELTANLIMIHFGRRLNSFDIGDHTQTSRLGGSPFGVQRNRVADPG